MFEEIKLTVEDYIHQCSLDELVDFIVENSDKIDSLCSSSNPYRKEDVKEWLKELYNDNIFNIEKGKEMANFEVLKEKSVKYVLKLDRDYYAGQNEKYYDLFNISGTGALGAKQLTLEEANRLKKYFSERGFEALIEEYNPRKYLKESLNKILVYEMDRRKGKDCGYAIANLTDRCLRFLDQI